MQSPKLLSVLTFVNLVVLCTLLLATKPTNPTDKVAPSLVRAQAIELVDAEGNVRGQLFLGPDGGGNIRLRAPNGEVRVKIGATLDGGGLMFADKRTEPAVQLHAGGKAGPALTLTNAGKKERVIAP
ncbi:MAG TPA: hypothetical protein VFW87_22395 [Pirellulales bacterium]|nr:hypothetical protein [Pirellulales bacterium]